jgi:SAM-dependent methyltransferase
VRYDGRFRIDLPWDFTALAAAKAATSSSLLDLGTGGGEWLSELPHRPADTVATEGWQPNVAIARERLAPLGIEVFAVEGAPENAAQRDGLPGGDLPFERNRFHLVTSRHEAYLAAEVYRVLAPGGQFLTQQIGSGVSDDFYRLFGEPVPAVPVIWDLSLARRQLEGAGLRIETAAEGYREMRFDDVGALAWYLKNVPFVYPGFSIEAARDRLETLHHGLARGEKLRVRQPIFWLQALKPVD